MGQAALQDAVPGDLTHVTGAEFEHLGSNGILLHEGLLQHRVRVRSQQPLPAQPVVLSSAGAVPELTEPLVSNPLGLEKFFMIKSNLQPIPPCHLNHITKCHV